MHETSVSKYERFSSDPDWVVYNDDLLIHEGLYKRGIIAVKPYDESCKTRITDQFFIINKKTFYFQQMVPNVTSITQTSTASASKHDSQFESAVSASSVKPPRKEADTRSVDKAVKLLTKITATDHHFDFLIFNEQHREDVFLPVAHNDRGFYLFPWLSKANIDWNFTGFEQFVTAGCLFGTDLKGRDDKTRTFLLIKHNYDGDIITSIIFNQRKPSTYEEMFFSEFEKMCGLINRFSDKTKPKKLFFHLPYLDYVLFGVELHLRNKITLNAFKELIDAIFYKKNQYATRIEQICKKHSIEVTIGSPFENLFDSKINNGKDAQPPHDVILGFLKSLGVVPSDIPAQGNSKDNASAVTHEFYLVKQCLDILRKNTVNITHAKVWDALLKASDASSINNLEELFKIANAAFIAMAADGKPNYKTCSVLPLSEKQIQVGYSKYCKNPKLESTLPAVVNLTFLDSFLTYSPATNGLMFYFDSCKESILKMIKDDKMMEPASRAVAKFVRCKSKKSEFFAPASSNIDKASEPQSSSSSVRSDSSHAASLSSSPRSVSSTSSPIHPTTNSLPSSAAHSLSSSPTQQTKLNETYDGTKIPRTRSCGDINSNSRIIVSNFLFKGNAPSDAGRSNIAPVNNSAGAPGLK